VRTIKEYQLGNCGIFEPLPFLLSRMVHDEWTAWHKLWRNLGATENQIQCLILLDVEACIHEEVEEIEVWSPSYPRSSCINSLITESIVKDSDLLFASLVR